MLSKTLLGSREVDEGKGGQIYADERTFGLGGEHTMQYIDDVLLKHTLETHIMIFLIFLIKKISKTLSIHCSKLLIHPVIAQIIKSKVLNMV